MTQYMTNFRAEDMPGGANVDIMKSKNDSGSNNDGESGGVPEGSIPVVMEWVGDDEARAQQALDAENKKDNPRSSLVNQLNDKLGK